MNNKVEKFLIAVGIACVFCLIWEMSVERFREDVELIKKYHKEMILALLIVIIIVYNELRKATKWKN